MRTVRCSDRREGGVCRGGAVCSGVCVPRGGLPDTPLWTEWQTGVKTLPCRNFVADGNYLNICFKNIDCVDLHKFII